ncbi:MAG TPA: helix-turn-helix transcriptional regulator [Solirubrobacteraceae bacterium]|nr:helix-turn-helix transcriptional regulator [Solirubrobacteraceae bacterium]
MLTAPPEVIAQLRAELGLSRTEAARAAGLTPGTWAAIESGATERPHPATKVGIARALGVPPSRIWRHGPRPLHLIDVEDARWESAVRRTAQRLAREGTAAERRHFGEHLAGALDCIDPHGLTTRWDELWEIAANLALGPQTTPIDIVDGRLVESAAYSAASTSRSGPLGARRGGVQARRGTPRGRAPRR